MSFWNWLTGAPAAAPEPRVRAEATTDGGVMFNGLDDPALLNYMRSAGYERGKAALFNTVVFRALDLISGAIGALPFRPVRVDADGNIVEAKDHPLYEVLNGQANSYQTSVEFKQLMQLRMMIEGDAFARIVRSRNRVIGLLPSANITCRLNSYDEPVYRGSRGEIPASDVFHLRDMSLNGINGLSRVRMAARAIGLNQAAEDAAINIFKGGISAGGSLNHPGSLSEPAHARLKKDFREEYAGAQNAGKWMILEEGMTATPFQQTSKDSQLMERSKHQVEEIARVMGGVPRPLLCVDDTSWGSGVEQLGILFVRFCLMPQFVKWETRGRMSLLDPSERKTIALDFDESELLRGSMKDLGDFLAKAVGGNGNNSLLTQNEGRRFLGAGRHPDGDRLAFTSGDLKNVPAQTA